MPLVRPLDDAIEAFFATLDPAFHDRVTLMTFSEFGRTVRANGSGGTDHGTAAPLLVVGEVTSLDEALQLANATEYGLTAGIFSRDDDEVRRFLDTIQAGTVYVNRRAGATTGAWPGIQSFGGWKGSGSSGKSGLGPYYVQQFMREQSQTIIADEPPAP